MSLRAHKNNLQHRSSNALNAPYVPYYYGPRRMSNATMTNDVPDLPIEIYIRDGGEVSIRGLWQ